MESSLNGLKLPAYYLNQSLGSSDRASESAAASCFSCAKLAPVMSTSWAPQDLIPQFEAVGSIRSRDLERDALRVAERFRSVAGIRPLSRRSSRVGDPH